MLLCSQQITVQRLHILIIGSLVAAERNKAMGMLRGLFWRDTLTNHISTMSVQQRFTYLYTRGDRQIGLATAINLKLMMINQFQTISRQFHEYYLSRLFRIQQ